MGKKDTDNKPITHQRKRRTETDKKSETWPNRLISLVFKHRTVAKSVRKGVESSAMMIETSAPSGSGQNSAGTSQGLAEASLFFETYLESLDSDGETTVSQFRTMDEYRARIEQYPAHEIQPTDEATEFDAGVDSYQTKSLILVAAKHSHMVYSKEIPPSPNRTVLKPTGMFKRTSIALEELGPGKDPIVVVSVRGSVSRRDWLVNGDGSPVPSHPDILATTEGILWHRGFLGVANAMHSKVMGAILSLAENISTTPTRQKKPDLLFTGHSAGGAVAQILYAMCGSPSHALSSLVPKFSNIHCIPFGAPPVSTSPIMPSTIMVPSPFSAGLFLNMVNEGDPVALLQQDYIHELMVLYAGHEPELAQRHPGRVFQPPNPVFRVSGAECVVLRDNDSEDVDAVGWNAVVVQPHVLERKLFGNPGVHHMVDYLERVQYLCKE